MSDAKLLYRSYQVWIKPGHRLFAYLDEACQNAKNLYNTTNFYIRQVFTAWGKCEGLQPLQQHVMDTLAAHIVAMNERRSEKNRSRPFELPSQERPFVSYASLDALFKVMGQTDYRALPTQSSQGIMMVIFQNWKAFFASIKDYRKHPEKYTGKPRILCYKYGQKPAVIAQKHAAELQGLLLQDGQTIVGLQEPVSSYYMDGISITASSQREYKNDMPSEAIGIGSGICQLYL